MTGGRSGPPRGGGGPRRDGGGPRFDRGPRDAVRPDRGPSADRGGGDRGDRITGPGERVVYGVGPVRELVQRRSETIKGIWVDGKRADKSASDPVALLVAAAREVGVRVEDRERDHLDRVAGEGALHQGVIAWLGEYRYSNLDAILAAAGTERPLIVMLDGVEDPRNLGAVLRSAYLLGAHGVVIPANRAAQVTSLVAKTSAGASELLPIAQVPNLSRALEELREAGLWRVAIHATEGAQPISAIDGTLPLCVVLGAEGAGIRPLVAKHCDFHALIPMARAEIGSFNVSVAASLALYELVRQRSTG